MSAPTPVVPGCCPPSCENPSVVNIPGTPGDDGETGASGVNGYDSYTTLTAPFTVPAENAQVVASVENSLWAVIGQIVFIQFAGYYKVVSKPSTTSVTLENLGYTGNAAPGVEIPSASQVGPAGLKGLDGTSSESLDEVSPTANKGDQMVDNGANSPNASLVAVPVGTNGFVWTADSTDAEGIAWKNVLLTTLAGFSSAAGGVVSAADTIIAAFGKFENRMALNDAKVTGTGRVLLAGDTMTGPLSFSGTTNAGLKLNSLTTTERNALTPANGMKIYNSTTNKFQSYENGVWIDDVGASVDPTRVLRTGDTMTGLLAWSGTTHAGIQLNSLTTTQRNALTPAVGQAIYNTTDSRFQGYEGAAWVNLSSVDKVSKAGDTMTGALVVQAITTVYNLVFTQSTLTYAATVDIDFNGKGHQTIALTGNLTLTTSNRGAGKAVAVRLVADGSTRNLTFPAGWIFIGAAAPASLAANKVGVLSLTGFGANDTDVICAYAASP